MKPFFILFLWFPLLLTAQVTDNFDDGNFTQNPVWEGTLNKFRVNSDKQLQLYDTISGEARLVTADNLVANTEWRFWVKFSFSPSANNYGRIYLVSNKADISGQVNGYFVQLGESGSNDAIELFRQQGENLTSICRGQEGFIASKFTLGLKIICNESGHWQLFADPSGGDNYQLQAEGDDNTFDSSAYLGIFCRFTKSNSNKMYFDDVYAGPIIIDHDPPLVKNVYPVSDSSLLVSFNEGLDKPSAETVGNYLLGQENKHPQLAELQDDMTSVMLVFSEKFQSGITYFITVSGVKDLAGNTMQSAGFSFSYYIPQPFDVVFNEIMADPSPPVALPEFEYLELYNRTANTINLNNWKLVIGTSEKVFAQAAIVPHGFLIIAKESATSGLSGFGSFYGFGSFSLKNSGQELTLYNNRKQMIARITYSDSWYQDANKADGGWSLEQINPDNICSQAKNWEASTDIRGGTPDSQNSVFAQTKLSPKLIRLEILADNILSLSFNELMDSSSLAKHTAYTVDHNIGLPEYIYTFADEPNRVELYFDKSFVAGIQYYLFISKNLTNCIGQSLHADTSVVFGIPDTAKFNDVIINEVLYNPLGNGVDYVELYNRSKKVTDLSKMLLGGVKNSPPNQPDTAFYEIAGKQMLFLPATYRLLTISPEKVVKQYSTDNFGGFVEMEHFPTLPNDKGTVLLENRSGSLIDAFNYSSDMQYPLLNFTDGVSLERIRFDGATNNRNNWHSAAETVGFGTPGYKNSQFVANDATTAEIKIDPEIFSPDDDGYNDMANIRYHFAQPGYSLTVLIFDHSGNLIRNLIENQYIGTITGSISWNGLQNNNTKAPIGIYIIYIRVFDLNGNLKEYKKTIVLGGKF